MGGSWDNVGMCWNPSPKCDGVRWVDLWKVIKWGGRSQWDPRELPYSLTCWRTGKMPIYEPVKKSLPHVESDALIMDFSNFRTTKSERLSSISPRLWYFCYTDHFKFKQKCLSRKGKLLGNGKQGRWDELDRPMRRAWIGIDFGLQTLFRVNKPSCKLENWCFLGRSVLVWAQRYPWQLVGFPCSSAWPIPMHTEACLDFVVYQKQKQQKQNKIK